KRPIRQHFALKWHLLRASPYRKQLAARFVGWREFNQLAQNPSTGFLSDHHACRLFVSRSAS
ncbi:hypothetical protein PQR02_36810, partial [Paraburkholderia sediminicola]